jgi:hypothetical protein
MCMAACNSWQTITATRALLGVVEAGFSPGVLFLLSSCEFFRSVDFKFSIGHTTDGRGCCSMQGTKKQNSPEGSVFTTRRLPSLVRLVDFWQV